MKVLLRQFGVTLSNMWDVDQLKYMILALSLMTPLPLWADCEQAPQGAIPFGVRIYADNICDVWQRMEVARTEALERMRFADQMLNTPYLLPQEAPNFLYEELVVIEYADTFSGSLAGSFAIGLGAPVLEISRRWEESLHVMTHEVTHWLWWKRWRLDPVMQRAWLDAGHGSRGDPLVWAINLATRWFINIPLEGHQYHPGYLPSAEKGGIFGNGSEIHAGPSLACYLMAPLATVNGEFR